MRQEAQTASMTPTAANMFRPPLARTSGVLDRAFYTKMISLAAATVTDNKNISNFRHNLTKSKDLLNLDRLATVREDPNPSLAAKGTKCLLLRPGVDAGAPETWSPTLHEAVKQGKLNVVPYDLKLDYNYYGYYDIMESILPEELHDEIPVGYNMAGHVAHLNLKSQYMPYKKVIAEVLLDKNPQIRTVINKTDQVGEQSVFRTFSYELLAGEDDLEVEVRENDCIFRFNYSKVYWNSKLDTEHLRLVNLFQSGQVVCDAMAGIGPFAVPAGKKGVFVWANDMNPESFESLRQATTVNKATEFVHPFNEDGRSFIPRAADLVYAASISGEAAVVHTKLPKSAGNPRRATISRTVPVPPTISHFVMNLPASAITFLPSFKGIYLGREELFAPSTTTKLPLVHVYCFSEGDYVTDIMARISEQLGVGMRLGDPENDCEVALHDVRDVSPKKRMFCATFRVPVAVAFAPRQ